MTGGASASRPLVPPPKLKLASLLWGEAAARLRRRVTAPVKRARRREDRLLTSVPSDPLEAVFVGLDRDTHTHTLTHTRARARILCVRREPVGVFFRLI